MRRLLAILVLLVSLAAPAKAIIEAEPDHTLLWSGFNSIEIIDSFAIMTTPEAIIVLQYDTVTLTYEPMSHVLLPNRPLQQKRSGNVITVRADGNTLYFLDIANLPEISLAGSVSFAYPFFDYALFGQDLYICSGYDGLRRYTMVDFGSMTLADSSMIGIHYTAVEIFGSELYALDDYNGIMRYQLTGLGFGTFIDYLYIPRRATSFTKLDSTVLITTYASEMLVAKLRPTGPVITDTVNLLSVPTAVRAVDSLAVALSPYHEIAELISLNSLESYNLQLAEPLDDNMRAQAFRFADENRFMAPTETGGIAMYRLDRVPIDPTPTRAYQRPGPVVDLFIRDQRLYTAGLANPVDIISLDVDGTPLSTHTIHEGLTTIDVMDQNENVLSVYFPSVKRVLLTDITTAFPLQLGSVSVRVPDMEGLFLNLNKIGSMRSLFAWNSGSIHCYAISDDYQEMPVFDPPISIVDRVLDVAIIDTILYVATGKGKIWRYRIYDDFDVQYRPSYNVPTSVRELTVYDNKLIAFSGLRMYVFDVSDPDPEATATALHLPVTAKASAIDGDRIAAVGTGGFALIDMASEPPALVDHCSRGGDIVAYGDGIVSISNGNYVFIYDTRDVVTDVPQPENTLPDRYALAQNYPNPFNPSTTINYSLPERSVVRLNIYNILGRIVTTLVDEDQPAGKYQIIWNGKNNAGGQAATGVYFYRLEADDFRESKKMILLK